MYRRAHVTRGFYLVIYMYHRPRILPLRPLLQARIQTEILPGSVTLIVYALAMFGQATSTLLVSFVLAAPASYTFVVQFDFLLTFSPVSLRLTISIFMGLVLLWIKWLVVEPMPTLSESAFGAMTAEYFSLLSFAKDWRSRVFDRA